MSTVNTRDYVRRNGGIHRRTIESETTHTVRPFVVGESVQFDGEFGTVAELPCGGAMAVQFPGADAPVYVSAASVDTIDRLGSYGRLPTPLLDLAYAERELRKEFAESVERVESLEQELIDAEDERDQLRDLVRRIRTQGFTFAQVIAFLEATPHPIALASGRPPSHSYAHPIDAVCRYTDVSAHSIRGDR